jgi:hypothetical protein
MRFRSSALSRLVGVLLLILALSPVTAPFSTIDLAQLLGDTGPHAGAIPQSKTTIDELATEAVPPFWVAPPPATLATSSSASSPPPLVRCAQSIPLRI